MLTSIKMKTKERFVGVGMNDPVMNNVTVTVNGIKPTGGDAYGEAFAELAGTCVGLVAIDLDT